ncbi:MAG: hypothetical protein AB7Q29_06870 [Vicinamibacterales bacterium]
MRLNSLCVRLAVRLVGSIAPRLDPRARTFRTSSGQLVRYAIETPTRVDPVAGQLLILCLHPGWGSGRVPRGHGGVHLRRFFAPALSDLDAILVAPDCPGIDWFEPSSESAVLELVDVIRRTCDVAPHAIVAAGLSDGATAAWGLVARHPEMFCAAAVAAGSPDAAIVEAWGSAPVFAVHSRADTIVPLAPTRAAVALLRLRGVAAELVVVEDAAHGDTARLIDSMRAAVPWLRTVLETAGRRESPAEGAQSSGVTGSPG